MKKIVTIVSIGFLFTLFILPAKAQKNASNKSSPDLNKTDKIQADADKYIKAAQDAKGKMKSIFPSKGDTVYAVIAGITYSDPNLKLLKKEMEAIKKTSHLTCSYKNGNAIVKVLYKGDASTMYDQFSNELKALFLPDDMEGTRMILTYTQAKPVAAPANQ
ncbi:hypothetical protein BH11BAC5_BH11BAC5_09840 [soil metagenome]